MQPRRAATCWVVSHCEEEFGRSPFEVGWIMAWIDHGLEHTKAEKVCTCAGVEKSRPSRFGILIIIGNG